ncbi:hypothetical protein E2C01_085683 [Portunus trituberculatus]|uniref:Uncharacterized protein n=1 Tax=Portunus trituberculatus TaxID=210409 RepID=A0A5B7J9K1_PORTR|nr:hypothetical protein [Portunus trituberculatus]
MPRLPSSFPLLTTRRPQTTCVQILP